MILEALSLDYDRRIQGFMLTARVDYEWYLSKTKGSEENLAIQRDIIKGTKAYQTLRADLRRGCILPAIVLSIRGLDVNAHLMYDKEQGFIKATSGDLMKIQQAISNADPSEIDIIDGLQRTNALRQTRDEIDNAEDEIAFLERSLRLEIWINIPFYAIAYRMLLLNVGQKPMSMKHQIDILSTGLAADLSDIEGLEIIKLKDHRRRVRPGQFHLSSITQTFQAWLQRNPNVDMKNIVVEHLIVDDALESLGIDLEAKDHADKKEDFRNFIKWIVQLDCALGDDHNRFLGNDTVILGIAAAIGFAHKNPQLRERLRSAMQKLLGEAQNDQDNPMGINLFEELRKNIDPKKKNVGEATRDLVFRAIREYIIQGGFSSMDECWAQAASLI